MALDVLDDPAKSVKGQRQQLQQVANADDKALDKLSPDEVRQVAKTGAAAAENAENSQGGEGDEKSKKSKPDEKPSSLKIKIELHLDVEVHLTARIDGEITIGLL